MRHLQRRVRAPAIVHGNGREHAVRAAPCSTLSPGDSVLVIAASQPPVPDEGNTNTLPVRVLNTFFRSSNSGRVIEG